MLAPSRRFVPGTVVLGRKFEPRRFGFEDDRKPSRVQVTQGHSLSAFYLYRCPRVSIDKMPRGIPSATQGPSSSPLPQGPPTPKPTPNHLAVLRRMPHACPGGP